MQTICAAETEIDGARPTHLHGDELLEMIGTNAGLVENLSELLWRKLVARREAGIGSVHILRADRLADPRDLGTLQHLVDKLFLGFLCTAALALQAQESDALGNVARGDHGVVDRYLYLACSLSAGADGNAQAAGQSQR
ncbi:hypothetical protein D3C87_1637120 [compost metagenome]